MVRKRNGQHSSCPEDWLKAGIKVPVHLTVRQEQYAARAVGIARSVVQSDGSPPTGRPVRKATDSGPVPWSWRSSSTT